LKRIFNKTKNLSVYIKFLKVQFLKDVSVHKASKLFSKKFHRSKEYSEKIAYLSYVYFLENLKKDKIKRQNQILKRFIQNDNDFCSIYNNIF